MRPMAQTAWLFLLLISVPLAGCGPAVPSGKWTIEPQVAALFESGTVLPGHSYYYLGSITAPDSIIAIDRRFSLRTRVWAEVEMTEQRLNGWLHMYRTQHYPPACEYRGGVILTPDGQQAGVWYSQNVINIILQPEPGVLEVYQPRSISLRTCGQENDDGPWGR